MDAATSTRAGRRAPVHIPAAFTHGIYAYAHRIDAHLACTHGAYTHLAYTRRVASRRTQVTESSQ